MISNEPSTFTRFKGRRSSGSAFTLILTDGTDTWHFSTKSFELHGSDVTVHDGVTDFGPISHSIDPYSMRYEFANVRVQLNGNWSRRNSDGTWGTIADLVRKAWNRTAQIRWHVGGISQSGSLLIFDGTVANIEYTDDGSIDLTLDEREAIKHRTLPQRYATTDIWPKLVTDSIDVPMPLIWGSPDEGIYHRQTGFHPCMLIENYEVSGATGSMKYLVSDHVSDFVDAAWFRLRGVDSWAKAFAGITSTLDDGGRTTLEVDIPTVKMYAYVYPTASRPTSTATDGANDVPPGYAFDNDEFTKVSVISESTTEASIILEWTQQGDDSNDPDQNSIAPFEDFAAAAFGLELHRTVKGGVTVTSHKIEVWDGAAWVTFDTSSTTGSMSLFDFHSEYNYTGSKGALWHLGTGPALGDGDPFKVRVTFTGSGWTANSTVVGYIHEARLRLKIHYPHDLAWSKAVVYEKKGGWADLRYRDRDPRSFNRIEFDVSRQVFDPTEPIGTHVFVECQGREYGAWIDGGGRSNGFNEGQVIERPVFQVESILRDELDMTNASIDQGSFDSTHSSVGGNISFVSIDASSKTGSKQLIELICYEHGFFLFRTHEGKIKAVDYLGTGDLVATLEPTDLVSGLPTVRLSNINRLANDITISHTATLHDARYVRSNSSTDSASITAYGTVPSGGLQLKADTIRDSALTASLGTTNSERLTDRLIDVERLLSRPHRFVKLATVGAKFADGELGDTINLNATAFDPVMKCMGDTWSGLDLMIISKEMTERGVTFDTIIWAAPSI